jgi:putative hydrolase
MSDDLFSQFFRLFDAPGPVNLRLAAEVAHHLVGEAQPVDPWAAEEFRELTRLAEFRVDEVAPFTVSPAPDVLPVDARRWVDKNLAPLGYLAEPFAGIIDFGALSPETSALANLAPAMVGIQLGTLVGSLGRWVMAGFDAGVPAAGDTAITYVVPNIDDFATRHGFDPRDVKLWVALNETAHRAIFRNPFVTDHLHALLQAYASSISIGPDKLMALMSRVTPEDLASGSEIEQLTDLFDTPQGRIAHRELAAFLGLTGGYRRLLAGRAAGTLLPSIESLDIARDSERDLGDSAGSSALTATFVESDDLQAGHRFCLEVDRRFGEEALAGVWNHGRFPTAAEIEEPVGWAARVLLDDLD